ncbi:MAG: COX15/CtaA family protein [Chloroflexi bacterium]|nr:COX15/CtaA family protein [Chloroflexota bacterium]
MKRSAGGVANSSLNAPVSPFFIAISLATALLTLGLIVFGAVVRVTESGLGCGNDWPLCNGTIFPPLDNITAWIEWLHRLFALLIGLFGLVMLALAWRRYRDQDRRVLNMTVLAALLFLVQSGLGAVVVFLDLPPTFVTLHLGVAMLLLGALLGATMLAWYQPRRPYQADTATSLAGINAAFALLIILTGALTRGSGATLACTAWPLCSGAVLLPIDEGPLALINMLHRLSVLAMALTMVLLQMQIERNRDETLTKWIARAAGLAYLAQIGVGAMFVISAAGGEWGALHVGLAATVWGLLVALVLIERINHQSYVSAEMRPA